MDKKSGIQLDTPNKEFIVLNAPIIVAADFMPSIKERVGVALTPKPISLQNKHYLTAVCALNHIKRLQDKIFTGQTQYRQDPIHVSL